MIRYEEALSRLEEALPGPLPSETVPLERARERVAAEDLSSREALPPFDNSAMDGYAVRARDLASASAAAPVRLPVGGSSSAGDAPARPKAAGGAWEIMTGAPLPAGFDSVVKVEAVRILDGGRAVEFDRPVPPGEHVREKGSDYAPGARAVSAGTILDPRHILALAALGVDRVPVRREPLVAVIATGRELAEPGEPLKPGQIRNATASYLLAVLPLLGARARYFGACPDDPADFRRRAQAALSEQPDILLTTGAVSMGKHDFVAEAASELGVEPLYHKVAVRPGKPALAGRFKDGTLFFGMPGNPIATVVGVRFFLVPALRRLLGLPKEVPQRLPLARTAAKPAGLRCFFKAQSGTDEVSILTGQASFQIQPLLQANAWAVLPEEGDAVPAGAEVDVYPLLPQAESGTARTTAPGPAATAGCC